MRNCTSRAGGEVPGQPGRATRAPHAAAFAAVVALLAGCERKAPGPDECVLFADAWLRSQRLEHAPQVLSENARDELVVRCLTEPYDRELVSCVLGGLPRERCRIDYLRRSEARRESR